MRKAILLGFLLISCSPPEQKHAIRHKREPPYNSYSEPERLSVVDTSDEIYPVAIKALRYEHIYDKSKWFLYCIHSDKVLNFIDKGMDTVITYGKLPLRLDEIRKSGDTTICSSTFSPFR